MENGKEKTGATEEPSINMVGVIKDRKFIPYGMTGVRGGIPVYVFATYEDYEAAAPTLPEECMIVTLDDLDTGGFEFDSETSETSENALQNKTITAIIKTMDQEREILAQQAQGVYEGRNLADVFDAEISRYSSEWEWIKDRNDTGFYKGIFVADFLPLTMTDGEYVEEQIAGINCYKGTTDRNIGNHIDFISRDCLLTTVTWNIGKNNNGNTADPCPYQVSNMKSHLRSTVYNKVPDKVKSVINSKRWLAESRYSENGALSDSTGTAWKDMGDLWLPTEYELAGSAVYGTRGYSTGLQVQYPLFVGGARRRVKNLGQTGGKCAWWTSTVFSGNSIWCVFVLVPGQIAAGDTINVLGHPLCFRISQ